ncbi:NAD(P)-binding domain-containing protein [Pseudomonas citronellolis]|uniref:NAD(P)-binding domain-containing protein n=1 Tax=Pseudomonas citronellolis TaxID=53408 RepID=UPI0008529745|nr:NAD(P)-binding domain-containing protein [Pseudomonas humi]
MHSLGILGVGELTEKVVRGLRRSGFDGRILLSPRNHERSAQLAADCRAQVMDSNQAVVDAAELLVVGVRPDALAALADEVRVPPGRKLVSLVAGVGLRQLAGHFPGARCVRAMLSYAAQFNQSTVVVCPPDAATERALRALGHLVVLQEEADFELATVAACMNGWFYFFLHDLQQWLVEKGLPADKARSLVLDNMQDCIASARHHPGVDLRTLGQAIATPGTYTANGLDMLNHLQANAHWGAACEVVLDALLTRSSGPGA